MFLWLLLGIAHAMKPCIPGSDESSRFHSTADGLVNIAWPMIGTVEDTIWGTEHMAPLVAIAGWKAGRTCTYLEVGAHVGWLVLLAARMGCKVFAWEGSKACAQRALDNLKLNNIDSSGAEVFAKYVGPGKGSNIQDDIPAGTQVTLLKMDIDGPDSSAMLGMDQLFADRRVQYVNLEYSRKQAKKDSKYLYSMDKRGFDIYLLDCYGGDDRTNEPAIHQATGGRARCLNRDPLVPAFNRHIHKHLQESVVDVPMPPMQRRFLLCFVASEPTTHCAQLLLRQQILPQYFDAFTKAIGRSGETDLILKLRTGSSPYNASAPSWWKGPFGRSLESQQLAGVEQEYEQLAVLLESLTVAAARVGKFMGHLKDRTWKGKSHIGTRPQQYQEYYSLVREERPKLICEIGMNAGHSSAVFLSAAGRDANVLIFDLGTFSYSSSSANLLEQLFPGQLKIIFGDSKKSFPAWVAKHRGKPCDLFSVDGDHTYAGSKADMISAINATRAGGVLVLDDMLPGKGPRRAFDELRSDGYFTTVRCTENVPFKISSLNRYDTTTFREQTMSWCFAWVKH